METTVTKLPSEELIELGGKELLEKFAKSLDLSIETQLKVFTDKGVLKLVYISRIRRILLGSPNSLLDFSDEGIIGKPQAADALLKEVV